MVVLLQVSNMGRLAVTWGDGSGNGCGGTFNWVNCNEDLEASTMETWLGV